MTYFFPETGDDETVFATHLSEGQGSSVSTVMASRAPALHIQAPASHSLPTSTNATMPASQISLALGSNFTDLEKVSGLMEAVQQGVSGQLKAFRAEKEANDPKGWDRVKNKFHRRK